tara:strand:- start:310 stop:642 length:333 start_codon:yes stop_codon:yes gene_type:complete
MSKKSVELEPIIKNYDPKINDAKPIKFNGTDIFCDEPSWVIDLYSSIFNQSDSFIETKYHKLYWKSIIADIKETENTGIIKKQCSNKTEVEKRKSVIKFIKRIISDIDIE